MASAIQEFNRILQPGIILTYDTLYVSLEKESKRITCNKASGQGAGCIQYPAKAQKGFKNALKSNLIVTYENFKPSIQICRFQIPHYCNASLNISTSFMFHKRDNTPFKLLRCCLSALWQRQLWFGTPEINESFSIFWEAAGSTPIKIK